MQQQQKMSFGFVKFSVLMLLGSLILLFAYLLSWPVVIAPQYWQAPVDAGYEAEFEANNHLQRAQLLALKKYSGPEAVVASETGDVFISTHQGWILQYSESGGEFIEVVDTGGRPLGLAIDGAGDLIIADAYKGLLKLDAEGTLLTLVVEFGGQKLGYINDVAVASDGSIYFTDSTAKFPAQRWGGTYPASLLDIMEHGGHGRLFRFQPDQKKLTLLAADLNFANGVAVLAQAQPGVDRVFVSETGHYRLLSFTVIDGVVTDSDVVRDNLPGFPDNLSVARDGNLWLGLVSPRSRILDKLSDKPWLRSVLQRLPAFIRPKAQHYGLVIKLTPQGDVVEQLHDPSGVIFTTTGVAETAHYRYISRLHGDALARLPQPAR